MEYLQKKKSFLVSHKFHFLVLLKCSRAIAEKSIHHKINITNRYKGMAIIISVNIKPRQKENSTLENILIMW